MIKIKGTYSDLGKIELENGEKIDLNELSDEVLIPIPFGSQVQISIEFEENNFISGKDGIVWASYHVNQIDIIRNALFAQNIITEVDSLIIGEFKLFTLKVISNKQKDIEDAIDFIWKIKDGLRLKPDWFYKVGEANKSFEQWLNEH